MNYIKTKKNIILSLVVITTVIIVIILVCNVVVVCNAKDKVFDKVEDLPYREVGLVLGTAPVTPWGTHNYYYDYRMEAAMALWQAGKVDYFIVSGDNHSTDYDEPSCMRNSLIVRGVPKERIILDYAGFRTLDSVVRCKEIFGQESITIISQAFHNKRAIYLAVYNGMNAVALNAKDLTCPRSKWLKIHSRELLARVKMFIDLVVGKQPRFLGEKVEFQ